jgi:hypothetical protein
MTLVPVGMEMVGAVFLHNSVDDPGKGENKDNDYSNNHQPFLLAFAFFNAAF